MTNEFNNFPKKDILPLTLRSIYESYGYKKYSMGRFEPYDMYMENKSFLNGSGIITFTDSRGRLMALKPDVTMSIIKNTAPEMKEQKLFYCENVFRSDSSSKECKEISQIGLEYIGADGAYAEAEVILLAIKSLETIDENYVLDISHNGFMAEFLRNIGFSDEQFTGVLSALEKKSMTEISALSEAAGISGENTKKLCGLCNASGDFEAMLDMLRALADTDKAKTAVAELDALYGVMKSLKMNGKLRLDFSAVGDVDYYNGLIFKGYVNGVPRAVLAGGRYDSLVKKLGKTQKALGFALYIGELDRILRAAPEKYDAEVLLIYDGEEPSAVAAAVSELRKRFSQVCALRQTPADFRAKHTYTIKDGKVEEI